MKENVFLHTMQTTQPALWETIVKTSQQGLIIIDEENDAITATNRLLWTYPDLHEALNVIINSWSEKELKQSSKQVFHTLTKNIKDTHNG